MSSFIYQVQINFKRIILRNKRFFFFDVVLPIFFYVLYSKIFVGNAPQAELKIWQLNYLISMIIYGCLLGSTITVANTLLEDQTSHFDTLSRLTPLPRWKYYLSRVIIFLLLNLIAAVGICITGIFINHLSLPIKTWSFIILATLIGTIPLIFIGTLISLSGNPATVNLLNNLVTFPLAILSGLWMPMNAMPTWVQSIGKLTPTFQLSKIDKALLNSKAIDDSSIIGITLWFLVLSVGTLLVMKYQKNRELTFA